MTISLISRLNWSIRAAIQTYHNRRLMRQADACDKVFCIGLNKTGTTSWAQAMKDLGFIVGSETKATMFFYDYVQGDFNRIVEYCRTDGEVFQDFPFSLPNTYQVMDRAFPGSKFVLTVRDSADQWYESITSFHSKFHSRSGQIPPTAEDLKRAVYWRRGLLAHYCHYVFKTPSSDPYHRETLLGFYQDYTQDIQNYFSTRPNVLLILNVSEKGALNRLRTFLSMPPGESEFPWENKT